MKDLDAIKDLIELVKEAGIAELEVQAGDKRVRIVQAAQSSDANVAAAPVEAAAPRTARSGTRANVVAPLSGTFYRAPAPGEAPFVAVGDQVAAGDVVCIIESMKMMNQVKSDVAGAVVEVLLDDGQSIEAGTGLFRIR